MERTSATEARVHFGELMRRVAQEGTCILVERDGRPQMVMVPIEEYERLKKLDSQSDWRAVMKEAIRLRDTILERRDGRPLPDPAEVIRKMREERDEQLTGLR